MAHYEEGINFKREETQLIFSVRELISSPVTSRACVPFARTLTSARMSCWVCVRGSVLGEGSGGSNANWLKRGNDLLCYERWLICSSRTMAVSHVHDCGLWLSCVSQSMSARNKSQL